MMFVDTVKCFWLHGAFGESFVDRIVEKYRSVPFAEPLHAKNYQC